MFRVDAARADRLRVARGKLRAWIGEIEAAHPGYLSQSHEAISAEIATLIHTLIEDLWFWRKQGFRRACLAFIETTEEECRPASGCHPQPDEQRDAEHWRKPGKLLAARLDAILKRI